ncbi:MULTISPECIES: hypothetical protein, partial [Cyanophyceae]
KRCAISRRDTMVSIAETVTSKPVSAFLVSISVRRTHVDLEELDDFPVFRHAVVKLESEGETLYLDGFGLHTEAEFRAKWVLPDEQNNF